MNQRFCYVMQEDESRFQQRNHLKVRAAAHPHSLGAGNSRFKPLRKPAPGLCGVSVAHVLEIDVRGCRRSTSARKCDRFGRNPVSAAEALTGCLKHFRLEM